MKNYERRLKRVMIVLGSILAVFVAFFIFLMVWFLGAKYPAFSAVAKEEFEIPALSEGLCPQGLCALPDGAGYDFAVSGYMTDRSPSRVYLVKKETGEKKYFTLERDGKAVTSHFGGVTCTENFLLVADGKYITRVSLSDALGAENGAAVPVYDGFETGINNAFCYYQKEENLLFAGEFYREKNYKTDASHHLEKDGETNYAFVYAYRADESKKGGVTGETPLGIFSVRGLVQGICVTAEKVYLSCSYGLADSQLYVYSNPFGKTASGSAEGVPVYRLDHANLLHTLTMPCMSEEICIKEGRIYVLFESLCNKYKYFVRVRMHDVVSVSLDKIGDDK